MKLTILVVFEIFLAINCFGQPCPNGITTNPSNPVNPGVPAKANTFFDWRTQFYQVNSNTIAASQIESPFYQNNNNNVSHFFENKDMKPEDGWELITYDMGFNENGTPKNPPTDYVFVVLYNKYTGILRVFLAGNGPSFNGAKIQIQFHGPTSEKLSSVLTSVEKLFPLDVFEADTKQIGVTNYLNGLGKWFYADFQMAYDVCTCLYESTLWISVDLLSTATINLKGTITGTITPVANINQTAGSVTEDGFSLKDIIGPDIYGFGKRAQKAFKSGNEFATSVEKSLGINNKTNAELTPSQLNTRNALGQLKTDLATNNFLKKGLKAAPYISVALDLLDFFTGGGKATAGTNTPMALNASISLSGNLTSAFQYRNIFFYTPGSLNAANKEISRYPYYNEVLGVFSLLTSPKVYFKNPYPYGRWDYQLVTPTSNGFEYVINPSAGFDLSQSEIMGNLKLRQFSTVSAESGLMPLEALRNFKTFFVTGALIPNNAQLEIFLNLKRLNVMSGDQNVLIKATYNIEIIQNELFNYTSLTFDPTPSIKDLIIQNQTVTTNKTAWNSVTVKPTTTIRPITTISLTASQLIESYPTTISQPSSSRISEFCSSSVYRDNPNRNPANLRTDPDVEVTVSSDKLLSSYPNPVNRLVTFNYHLETNSFVKLEITRVTGEIIAIPINEYQESGFHEVEFDMNDLSNGVYLYTLQTTIGKEVKRLVVIH